MPKQHRIIVACDFVATTSLELKWEQKEIKIWITMENVSEMGPCLVFSISRTLKNPDKISPRGCSYKISS